MRCPTLDDLPIVAQRLALVSDALFHAIDSRLPLLEWSLSKPFLDLPSDADDEIIANRSAFDPPPPFLVVRLLSPTIEAPLSEFDALPPTDLRGIGHHSHPSFRSSQPFSLASKTARCANR